jgi:hypothetical protein
LKPAIDGLVVDLAAIGVGPVKPLIFDGVDGCLGEFGHLMPERGLVVGLRPGRPGPVNGYKIPFRE